MSIENEYETLINQLVKSHGAISGQMFGKQCIKISGKAAVAKFKECVVFKLPLPEHAEAMKLENSVLWDPSGKGRAMKEWVQVDLAHKEQFPRFANTAAAYVS